MTPELYVSVINNLFHQYGFQTLEVEDTNLVAQAVEGAGRLLNEGDEVRSTLPGMCANYDPAWDPCVAAVDAAHLLMGIETHFFFQHGDQRT